MLLGMVLLCFGRGRSAFISLFAGFGWLYLASTPFVAGWLMATLEQDYPPRAMSATRQADVIVLLGGSMRGDVHMGRLPDLNEHADRLVHAVSLFKAGKAPLVLVSGGGEEEDRPEAEQIQDILIEMGVPKRQILLERQSRDTHDNAVYSAVLLKAKKLDRVLLVTSAWHMRRAQALFQAQGIEVVPAPTDYQRLVSQRVLPGWLPGVSSLRRTTYALHEILGYQVYRWRGWL